VIFESGTVFKWNQFPEPRYDKGNIKARWFIYLGDSGILSTPILAYICTTTTQKKRTLQIKGINYSHQLIEFKPTNSPFEEECVLDCDEPPYSKDKKIFENNPDIQIKGSLDEQKMREIYNGICKSNAYSPKILNDIHDSLNKAGIMGLKRPK
jgi:hypothetical protein